MMQQKQDSIIIELMERFSKLEKEIQELKKEKYIIKDAVTELWDNEEDDIWNNA